MIYTVTFNPAIDYVISVKDLKTGEINRTESEEVYYGGKGINVSIVLNNLGIKSRALGFIAGTIGEALTKGLTQDGIDIDFIKLASGNTRINVKIKGDTETDINGIGPDITTKDIKELYNKIDKLGRDDILVLAGSIPQSVPDNIYEVIMSRLEGKGVRIIVDATKDLLLNVLKYKPFLVKPNNYELAEMFDTEINSIDDVKLYAGKLKELGAQNVIVSMAADGALLYDSNDCCHMIGIHKGKTINSVGAGDSMVAGFIAGVIEYGDYEKALKLGTAAGGATAMSMGLGTKEMIMDLYNKGGITYENC